MIKLTVNQINKNIYKLKDEENAVYELILKFLDTDIILNVGDAIFMKSELLRRDYKGYSNFYNFGPLDSVYGKQDVTFGDIDVIKIYSSNRAVVLKRLYG